jgi:hypothetical protein
MRTAERIIERFGGLSALAQALGHKHASTVQRWKESGFIPARHQQRVLDAARDKGISLDPSDFFDDAVAPEPVETVAGR